eukprot:gene1037-1568_t
MASQRQKIQQKVRRHNKGVASGSWHAVTLCRGGLVLAGCRLPARASLDEPAPPSSLHAAALDVLHEPDPFAKATMTAAYHRQWFAGDIPATWAPGDDTDGRAPPDRPGRSDLVRIVDPADVPRRRKGLNDASARAVLLHSLCHIESWAVDLSWDAIARFGAREDMPRGFFDDFCRMAADEARHFLLLVEALERNGAVYGDYPAHDGLWDNAMDTKDDLLLRLAVEHAVHEARGLDVLPGAIRRFRKVPGAEGVTCADMLEGVIYPEEITHCAAGVRWFRYLHRRRGYEDAGETLEEADEETACQSTFHDIVRKHFHGLLKPPFNHVARAEAGMPQDWYLPVASKGRPTQRTKTGFANGEQRC